MVVVGGVITNLGRKFTKKGDQMAVFVLEDLESSIEVTVFPRTLAEQGHKLEDDVIVTVKGRLDRRDESRFGLIGQTITVLSLTEEPGPAAAAEAAVDVARRAQDPSPEADPARSPGRFGGADRHRSGQGAATVRRVPRRHRPLGGRAAHGVRPRSRRPVVNVLTHRRIDRHASERPHLSGWAERMAE